MHRRQLLTSTALLITALAAPSSAAILKGGTPEPVVETDPPTPVGSGPWAFFTLNEARAVEAIVDRIIPSDELGAGAREAGCAVFIDRQLAGGYGKGATLYLRGPIQNGYPEQGPQSARTPAQIYRDGLAALDGYCRELLADRPFAALTAAQQDMLLQRLEDGTIGLPSINERAFFALLVKNTREGFMADPIYGGNRDMAGWKLVGFPGARYDYRGEIGRRGEALHLDPVGLLGRNAWHPG